MQHNPHNRDGHGRGVSLLVALMLVLGAQAAHGATFRLASQNCLHLGWGQPGYQNTKNGVLRTEFNNYDVVLLQEVMSTANLGAITPGNFTVVPNNNPLAPNMLRGSTAYKEAYVVLVRNGIANFGAVSFISPTNANAPQFSRPPLSVLLRTGNSYTWVVDFHAVFGKSRTPRNQEATAMMNVVYAGLQNTNVPGTGAPTNRIIMGGDWNLPSTAVGFNAFRAQLANPQILPNDKTSLKTNGGPSQRYDHFVWDQNVVNLQNCQVITPQSVNVGYTNLWWRQNVSDHLGITCTVNY